MLSSNGINKISLIIAIIQFFLHQAMPQSISFLVVYSKLYGYYTKLLDFGLNLKVTSRFFGILKVYFWSYSKNGLDFCNKFFRTVLHWSMQYKRHMHAVIMPVTRQLHAIKVWKSGSVCTGAHTNCHRKGCLSAYMHTPRLLGRLKTTNEKMCSISSNSACASLAVVGF